MGANSVIEWTHHTFNPWWGCQRVSPGCEHCYAETMANHYGHRVWGPAKMTPRRFFGEAHWREPLKWNRDAEHAGVRRRVFCASMADVFESNPLLEDARFQLWDLIQDTPWLDWLLLTKRPENLRTMLPWGFDYPHNVWLGTSVEDQPRSDERIPLLLQTPAAVRFLSCEPLLGPIDLRCWLHYPPCPQHPGEVAHGWGELACDCRPFQRKRGDGLEWIIAGGESGASYRPMDIDWARSLRDQSVIAGVAYFYKQQGGRTHAAGGRLLDGREWNQVPKVRVNVREKR